MVSQKRRLYAHNYSAVMLYVNVKWCDIKNINRLAFYAKFEIMRILNIKNCPYFTFIHMRKLILNCVRSLGMQPCIKCDSTVH
jgi:hypothetical protein